MPTGVRRKPRGRRRRAASWSTVQQLRIDVRRGTARPRRRLLLVNGVGASLELLQPFVDQRSIPRSEVIRFDVPGVGGSPLPACPTASPACAAG